MRKLMLFAAALIGLSAVSIAAPTTAEAQYYGGGYSYKPYYKPRYYAPPRVYVAPPVYVAPRAYYAPRYYKPRYYRY
jgi:hypothetical protein